jgi:acyl-CoA thioester hydrolase
MAECRCESRQQAQTGGTIREAGPAEAAIARLGVFESMFEKTFVTGWGDMDFNGHMRNTSFLDRSADVRMMFFAEQRFSADEFVRLKIGPVIMKDEAEYFKEVRLLDVLRVTLVLAGLAADGSRFLMRNEFFRADGKLAARVTSAGGWLDLVARKLVAPPAPLLDSLRALRRTDDFEELPSSIK